MSTATITRPNSPRPGVDHHIDNWPNAWLTADEAKAIRAEERTADIHAIEVKTMRAGADPTRYAKQIAWARALEPLSITPQPDLAAIKRRQNLVLKYAVRALVWGAGAFAIVFALRWAVVALWSAWTVTH